MDSMRSLNSSLPNSTPLSSRHQPQDQLLQAFKSAALSVTNLYKSAASSQAAARQEGYQDALADLLIYLDKENLGLMDGEGWKVRQWATERYSRGDLGANVSDDEEDNAVEEDARERSSSPVRPQRRQHSSPSRRTSPTRKERSGSPSLNDNASTSFEHTQTTSVPMFTFSAPPPASLDDDMSSERSTDNSTMATTSIRLSDAPVRLESHSRATRATNRDNGRNRPRTRDLRLNSSSKRKVTVPDFFDLSNLDKDPAGGGSSKRGRFA